MQLGNKTATNKAIKIGPRKEVGRTVLRTASYGKR